MNPRFSGLWIAILLVVCCAGVPAAAEELFEARGVADRRVGFPPIQVGFLFGLFGVVLADMMSVAAQI